MLDVDLTGTPTSNYTSLDVPLNDKQQKQFKILTFHFFILTFDKDLLRILYFPKKSSNVLL